eukprot:jgi/Mesvir1/12746/Mv20421-RA.1
MSICPSQFLTLEQLMAIPGLGAQVMSVVPVADRLRLRRTCRQWQALADQSLQGLTELFGEDMAGVGCHPSSAGLTWLLDKCPNLTALSMASRADHEEHWQGRDRWTIMWPRYKMLRIAQGLLSLEDIARRYQGLKYLNVASCLDVSDEGLMAIAGACRGLEALDVSGCYIGDQGVRAVADSCRGLQRLAVTHCRGVTDASIVAVAQHCRELTELRAHTTKVKDVGIIALVQSCPRLHFLEVHHRVSAAALLEVARHCPQLEHLLFGMDVTDEVISLLAANCPQLKWLDTRAQLNDDRMRVLAAGCGGLTHLLRCWGITDVGVSTIASNCPLLEHLEVARCEGVTDASITLLARGCPRLQHLSVAECGRVTDAGIIAVAESCMGLRDLYVQKTGVTSAGILAIAAGCHELRNLDMAHCRIDEKSLVAIARGCPKLEYVNVVATRSVTKESVAAISRYCMQLRNFSAGEDANLEDAVVGMIEEMGGRLQGLCFINSDISDRTIWTVAEHCPRLQDFTVKGSKVTWHGIKELFISCRLQFLECDENHEDLYALECVNPGVDWGERTYSDSDFEEFFADVNNDVYGDVDDGEDDGVSSDEEEDVFGDGGGGGDGGGDHPVGP